MCYLDRPALSIYISAIYITVISGVLIIICMHICTLYSVPYVCLYSVEVRVIIKGVVWVQSSCMCSYHSGQ